MSARTDRINELARKEKSVGLTPEEKAEQKKLLRSIMAQAEALKKNLLCFNTSAYTTHIKCQKRMHRPPTYDMSGVTLIKKLC